MATSLPRRSISPTGRKLRSTCNNCAASKIKCSREKPTCTRCAKRGLACEYFETKRAGRKQGSRSTTTSNSANANFPSVAQTQIQIQDNHNPPMTAFDSEMLASPGVMDTLPTLADPMASTPATTANYDFDDFLLTSHDVSFPMLELPNAYAGDLTDACHEANDDPSHLGNFTGLGTTKEPTARLLTPNDTTPSMDTAAVPESRPSSSTPQAPLQEPPPDSRLSITDGFNSGPTCCFLASATGLLKQSPSPVSASYHASEGQGFEKHHGPGRLSTIQSIITHNEQTLHAIGDILDCESYQDGYLLAILSTTILKVLGLYAAVVRQSSASHNDSPCWDTSPCSGYGGQGQGQQQSEQAPMPPTVVIEDSEEEQGHLAAQQILSKLHRVQRLINILSQRFKSQGEGEEHPLLDSSFAGSPDTSSLYRKSFFPFPGSILEQFEADLRKRLRDLSVEAVNILNRG